MKSVNVQDFLCLIETERTGQEAFCLDGSVSKISLAHRALTGFRVQSCYFQESEEDVVKAEGFLELVDLIQCTRLSI